MSELYILDTNILVHLVRADAVWQRIRGKHALLLRDPRPVISVVTDGELRSLAYQFHWQSDKRSQMEFVLGYFSRATIDHPRILDAYAVLDAHTQGLGHPMGKNDLWIAATAHATGACLLTTDRDFDQLSPQFLNREWLDPSSDKQPPTP